MNLLEKAIAVLSPQTALRRARAHLQLSQVRKYDAAASGRRTSGWMTASWGANAETAAALPKLRDRHRDLVRNNPWAARAVQAIVSHTIGYGITAKVTATKAAQEAWKRWAETTQCDADGRNNLYGLQGLVLRTVVESGECLVRVRWRKATDGLALPMQLQVLEPDYLDISRTTQLDTGRIVQGVEFDLIGRRVAYWLFTDHPGDVLGYAAESKRVPASDVAHIYRSDRPGQVRGVPWGAPTMLTLRDLDDYEDAYLFRNKLANCQVGVIFDSESGIANAEAAAAGAPLGEAMEPGRYEFLPPGKDIRFNTPPSAGDYGPYTRDVLLRVAAAYGVTFAALTGDLSSVNFSSGRMGRIDMHRNIDMWTWQMLAPQLLDTIVSWAGAAAELASLGAAAKFKAKWAPPRREMINPAQDVTATIDAVRGGLMSLPAAHRELGEDSEEVIAEIKESNAALDAAGIKLDSDPRFTKGASNASPPKT